VTAYYGDALDVEQAWLDELRTGIEEAVAANTDLDDALRAQFVKRLAVLTSGRTTFSTWRLKRTGPRTGSGAGPRPSARNALRSRRRSIAPDIVSTTP
jgi:hypothetical protein